MRPYIFHPFGKSIQALLFTLCPLSGINLDGIHKYFTFTIFRLFSTRGVIDNFKVTSYSGASRIIYEWGTLTDEYE